MNTIVLIAAWFLLVLSALSLLVVLFEDIKWNTRLSIVVQGFLITLVVGRLFGWW